MADRRRGAALEPMLATLATGGIPAATSCRGGCRYEPKWDGFRAIAETTEYRGVSLLSRRGKPLGNAFPEIVDAIYEVLPERTTVDGEIVCWANGRLDFAALQYRNVARKRARELVKTMPAHYIAFDVLRIRGRDVTSEPLSVRRQMLEELLAGVPGTSRVTLGMQTSDVDEARVWFDTLADVGVEGLVVKAAADPYRPGQRGGWQKVKAYASTEFLVGGVTGELRRPQELILGRYASDTGDLRIAARTTPLGDAAAAEIGNHLTRADAEHPWPEQLPPAWHSDNRAPVDYIRVVPELVVEARVDPATIGGERWRHGSRYLRLRSDLTADDVPHDLDLEL
ncbi:MAG: ATP-dependent DNA ligase [Pseudonocardia sp.]|nr:ATP-dependent DNA ligase [Pseudonocardia sp.]